MSRHVPVPQWPVVIARTPFRTLSPPILIRSVLFLLTALCLSVLSFQAAANARVAAPQVEAVRMAADPDYAMLATGDDLSQLVLPGDADDGPDDAIDDGPPPGYCNIWSADLLDPLDLFDAVDETSALITLPTWRLVESHYSVVQVPVARTTFQSEGQFRPPRRLA